MVKKLYEKSSGNVFSDLGLPDAESLFLKSGILYIISKIIKNSGNTQAKTSVILGISQPQISRLINGRGERFSVERLLNLLNKLGYNIDISVSKKLKGKAPYQNVSSMWKDV